MKTKLLPLFALLLLFALACNKAQEDTSPDTSFFLKCKIDGNDFKTDFDPLVSFGADLAKEGETFTILGKDEQGNGFSILLEGPLAEGTFLTKTVNGTIKRSITYEQPATLQSWSTNLVEGSGTITISKNHSNYLEGTFSFTGTNFIDSTTMVFTLGSFRAKKL